MFKRLWCVGTTGIAPPKSPANANYSLSLPRKPTNVRIIFICLYIILLYLLFLRSDSRRDETGEFVFWGVGWIMWWGGLSEKESDYDIALLLFWKWLLVIWTKTLVRYTESHKSDMISGHDRNALRKVIGCNSVGCSWGSRTRKTTCRRRFYLFFSEN